MPQQNSNAFLKAEHRSYVAGKLIVPYKLTMYYSWNCNSQRIISVHYENLPMQNTEIFSVAKMENFIGKNDFSNIFALNIHCGYKLEPPLRGRSNEYQQSFGSKIRKIG